MPSGNHTQVNTVAVGGGSTDVAVVVGGYGEVQWRRPVLELSSRNVELRPLPGSPLNGSSERPQE